MATSICLINIDLLYNIGIGLGIVAILVAIYTSTLMVKAIARKRAELRQPLENKDVVISIGYVTKSFKYPQVIAKLNKGRDSLHGKQMHVHIVTGFEKIDQYDNQSTYDLCEN